MGQQVISFSPPDIGEAEIEAVSEVLRSGWITTGPQTKQLEKELADYTQAAGVAALNSATAALECTLLALGIGKGDEVITSSYTYTASASPIYHVGATPILCDIQADSLEMDYSKLASLITPATKAIIPIDIAGIPCDYDLLFSILNEKKELYTPTNNFQALFDRVIVIADAAHSLGSIYKDKSSGSIADFTTFSFHAVKNLTTAEGGALTWRDQAVSDAGFYQHIMLLSLHGQTKDALSKSKTGAWEYDIAFPGYKYNMTDIMAAIGRTQLKRYPQMLARRKELVSLYELGFEKLRKKGIAIQYLPHFTDSYTSSGHLMITNLIGKTSEFRNKVIALMAEKKVATNVHYKPLPLLTAYKNLGFDINSYPCAYQRYLNEITFPLHTLLSNDDISYILEVFEHAYIKASQE